MSTMNRLANVHNKFQGPEKRVLCVCSAGLLRSPTAAFVLQRDFDRNTRAAGCIEDYALVPVDQVLMEWAEEIVCMTRSHMEILMARFPHYAHPYVVLDIPDDFRRMDPELQAMIHLRYKESLV